MASEDGEFRLWGEFERSRETGRAFRAGTLSVALHALALTLLILAPPAVHTPRRDPGRVARSVTPLIAPPRDLTQREPNRGKISREVDLEALLPRPQLRVPPVPRSRPSFQIPQSPRPAPAAPAPLPEPPKIEAAELPRPAPGLLPGPGSETAPPPPPPPPEKPKLAFERPGPGGAPGRLAPPSTSVQEAIRSAARPGGAGGLIVGDAGDFSPGGAFPGLNQPPLPGRPSGTVELLSDPMGVDFRPYLIRILSTVKRNWLAVIPESAKMGRRGKVVIQFSVSRDGNVPKLIIAMPSGAEPLDRAAVAGISASNPFPPLPTEFRGEQIRLQFSFLYNMSN